MANKLAAQAVKAGRLEGALTGANQRLERHGNKLVGTYYGRPIAEYDEANGSVTLRHFGVRQPGVRMAMVSFLSDFGYIGKVSFAKDKFSVEVNGRTADTEGDELEINVKLDRSCRTLQPALWARFTARWAELKANDPKRIEITEEEIAKRWTVPAVAAWLSIMTRQHAPE